MNFHLCKSHVRFWQSRYPHCTHIVEWNIKMNKKRIIWDFEIDLDDTSSTMSMNINTIWFVLAIRVFENENGIRLKLLYDQDYSTSLIDIVFMSFLTEYFCLYGECNITKVFKFRCSCFMCINFTDSIGHFTAMYRID